MSKAGLLLIAFIAILLTEGSLLRKQTSRSEVNNIICAGCGSSQTTTTSKGFPLHFYKTTRTARYTALPVNPPAVISRQTNVLALSVDFIIWFATAFIVVLGSKKFSAEWARK